MEAADLVEVADQAVTTVEAMAVVAMLEGVEDTATLVILASNTGLPVYQIKLNLLVSRFCWMNKLYGSKYIMLKFSFNYV